MVLKRQRFEGLLAATSLRTSSSLHRAPIYATLSGTVTLTKERFWLQPLAC